MQVGFSFPKLLDASSWLAWQVLSNEERLALQQLGVRIPAEQEGHGSDGVELFILLNFEAA